MLTLLPLIASVLADGPSATLVLEEVKAPRVAQVRLAESLAEAESIESVRVHERSVTFVTIRDGESFDVIATTAKSGRVVALQLTRGAPITAQLHGLTWLASELAETTAVTALVVDEDGAVIIGTSDLRRYTAIPGRGSGGTDVAVESRWAAAWNDAP
jgi:hypothetical protein